MTRNFDATRSMPSVHSLWMSTMVPSAMPNDARSVRVHEHHATATFNPAVAIVEAVDRGVELVVRANRLQEQAAGGTSTVSSSLTVIIALPVAVGKVRESRGPCGRSNPPGRRTLTLKSSKPGTTCEMCSRMLS